MTILYFSSTGNSLHVARSIAGDNGKLLALIDHHGASITDDCIGVVCPVVCGEIIPSVCRMIKSLRLRAPYIFGIVTYGYTPGHALKQLSQLLPGGSYFASVRWQCPTVASPCVIRQRSRRALPRSASKPLLPPCATTLSTATPAMPPALRSPTPSGKSADGLGWG